MANKLQSVVSAYESSLKSLGKAKKDVRDVAVGYVIFIAESILGYNSPKLYGEFLDALLYLQRGVSPGKTEEEVSGLLKRITSLESGVSQDSGVEKKVRKATRKRRVANYIPLMDAAMQVKRAYVRSGEHRKDNITDGGYRWRVNSKVISGDIRSKRVGKIKKITVHEDDFKREFDL